MNKTLAEIEGYFYTVYCSWIFPSTNPNTQPPPLCPEKRKRRLWQTDSSHYSRDSICPVCLLPVVLFALFLRPHWLHLCNAPSPVCPRGAMPIPEMALSPVKSLHWEVFPPMAAGRVYCTAALWAERLYVLGGCSESGLPLDSAEVLDLETQTWCQLPSLPTGRAGASAVALGDQLVVMGGMDAQQSPLASVEVYHPDEGKWERKAGLGQASMGITALEIGKNWGLFFNFHFVIDTNIVEGCVCAKCILCICIIYHQHRQCFKRIKLQLHSNLINSSCKLDSSAKCTNFQLFAINK